MKLSLAGTALTIAGHASAAATRAQVPFNAEPAEHGSARFDPLRHMSGIAPYHDAPGADIMPPDGCKVTAAAFLIRHSCIYGNDDEYDDFMEPFILKVAAATSRYPNQIHKDSPLKFLDTWKSPIKKKDLEELTAPGEADAFKFGKRFREMYAHLVPRKGLGKGRKKKGEKVKASPNYPAWHGMLRARDADPVPDSQGAVQGLHGIVRQRYRDCESMDPWIVPQEGKDGEGDGKYVSLVKVPNDNKDWAASLTPHKICPAFSKENGKPEAQIWLNTFGPAPLARLQEMAPHFDFVLDDVIALFMFCGYESVSLESRTSRFCSPRLFLPHEFHEFAYWNDIKYHYQVGYGAPISPYLGVGWLKTATHNLLAAYDPPHPHPDNSALPPPTAPPDAEHTQLLWAFFTHREEPPVALVALGLWNTTSLSSTSMDHSRQWKTSHVLPFLGHVALERINCSPPDSQVHSSSELDSDYIRIIVNGAVQELPSCSDGPGGSCEMGAFGDFVAERAELYKDFEGACKV